MGNRARLGILKPRLVPDVGILRRRGAERHRAGRLVAHIPGDAVDARPARAFRQLAHQGTLGIGDLEFDRALGRLFEPVVHERAPALHHAVRRTRRRQLRGLGRRRPLHHALLERRDVFHDVEAAAVGGEHQVVVLLLHHNPGDGRVRQAALQGLPRLAVVHRVVERVARCRQTACLSGSDSRRSPAHTPAALGQAIADFRPGLAEVGGLIDPGIAVVHQVEIHADVGRARRRSAKARFWRSRPNPAAL